MWKGSAHVVLSHLSRGHHYFFLFRSSPLSLPFLLSPFSIFFAPGRMTNECHFVPFAAAHSLARSSWTPPRAAPPWAAAAARPPTLIPIPSITSSLAAAASSSAAAVRVRVRSTDRSARRRLQCNDCIFPFPPLSLSNAPRHPVVGRPSHFAFPCAALKVASARPLLRISKG